MSNQWTSDEMMAVAAARELTDGAVCFVGIGLPSTAANVAWRMHAPSAVLIYESGCIGSRPDRLPASIGDGVLSESAVANVGVVEIFSYWLQAGRIDVGFLGAAQIDRFANINTTVIGAYDRPSVRLPGAGGAPEIAANCGEVIITLRHSRRAFVEELDFVTSLGHGTGNGCREQMGLRGRGPSAVISDLCVLRPDPVTKELTLTSVHPGVSMDDVRDATGWDLQVADEVEVTPVPSSDELTVLRDLKAAS
ncbi:MAG: CoA-transferase subunit beta [bacterium]|nr:CoA-transferase subunit beta [bacterium]